MNYMEALQAFGVPPEFVLPIVCKALAIHFDIECQDAKRRKREIERYAEFRESMVELRCRYYDTLGANAYALLNIISDIASHPSVYPAPSTVKMGCRSEQASGSKIFPKRYGRKSLNSRTMSFIPMGKPKRDEPF